MKRVLCSLIYLLMSCGERTYTAPECQSLEVSLIQRCFGGKLPGDGGTYIGDLKCWPFSKPTRMHGVWVFGLEASDFYPNATTSPSAPTDTWLETDLSKRPDIRAAYRRDGTLAFSVDFVGRQSLCDNNYGQFGAFRREIITEHVYALRRLPGR